MNTLNSAWIADKLLAYARQHGGTMGQDLSGNARAQLIEFLTFRDVDPNATIWANVSDGIHFIPAKFDPKETTEFMKRHREPLTSLRGGVFILRGLKLTFSRKPHPALKQGLTPEKHLVLEVKSMEYIGSKGEPNMEREVKKPGTNILVRNSLTEAERFPEIWRWVNDINQNHGNILKFEHANQAKPAAPISKTKQPAPTITTSMKQATTTTSKPKSKRQCYDDIWTIHDIAKASEYSIPASIPYPQTVSISTSSIVGSNIIKQDSNDLEPTVQKALAEAPEDLILSSEGEAISDWPTSSPRKKVEPELIPVEEEEVEIDESSSPELPPLAQRQKTQSDEITQGSSASNVNTTTPELPSLAQPQRVVDWDTVIAKAEPISQIIPTGKSQFSEESQNQDSVHNDALIRPTYGSVEEMSLSLESLALPGQIIGAFSKPAGIHNPNDKLEFQDSQPETPFPLAQKPRSPVSPPFILPSDLDSDGDSDVVSNHSNQLSRIGEDSSEDDEESDDEVYNFLLDKDGMEPSPERPRKGEYSISNTSSKPIPKAHVSRKDVLDEEENVPSTSNAGLVSTTAARDGREKRLREDEESRNSPAKKRRKHKPAYKVDDVFLTSHNDDSSSPTNTSGNLLFPAGRRRAKSVNRKPLAQHPLPNPLYPAPRETTITRKEEKPLAQVPKAPPPLAQRPISLIEKQPNRSSTSRIIPETSRDMPKLDLFSTKKRKGFGFSSFIPSKDGL